MSIQNNISQTINVFQTWRQIFDDTLIIRIKTKFGDFESFIKNVDISCRMSQRSPTHTISLYLKYYYI